MNLRTFRAPVVRAAVLVGGLFMLAIAGGGYAYGQPKPTETKPGYVWVDDHWERIKAPKAGTTVPPPVQPKGGTTVTNSRDHRKPTETTKPDVRDHRTPTGIGPAEARAIALRKCSETIIYCNKMCASPRSEIKRQDAHQIAACRTDCGNEHDRCKKRAQSGPTVRDHR